jgi:hypothetical protein
MWFVEVVNNDLKDHSFHNYLKECLPKYLPKVNHEIIDDIFIDCSFIGDKEVGELYSIVIKYNDIYAAQCIIEDITLDTKYDSLKNACKTIDYKFGFRLMMIKINSIKVNINLDLHILQTSLFILERLLSQHFDAIIVERDIIDDLYGDILEGVSKTYGFEISHEGKQYFGMLYPTI